MVWIPGKVDQVNPRLMLLAGLLLSPPSAVAQAERDTISFPLGLARQGNLIYWAERNGHVVRRMDLKTGEIAAVAGTGQKGFSGDGGPARGAMLSCPDWVDIDSKGNLFIADRCNERIRRVDAGTGNIVTVAGNGDRGKSADGPALQRSLMGPFFLALASDTMVLFTDTDANLIRQVDLITGHLTTLAGTGERGFGGDGGPAREATFARPHVVIRARNGDLLIGDSFNHRIRRVNGKTGVIQTIAGSGAEGIAEDGAIALQSPLMYFGTIVERKNGDLLITEWAGTGRVLLLEASSGRFRVIAGTTDKEASAAGGQKPLDTRFGGLAGLVVDDQGRLIVADSGGGIKRIDLKKGTVEILAGK